jgi:serine/threonine protein phosphatase 1
MFMFSRKSAQSPAGGKGRAYAVGDVHGRLDLLDQLLARIEADGEERGDQNTLLIFVGDLIDRGPSSAQVVERLRTYRRPGVKTLFLLGNHEEVLLRILAGEAELIEKWRWFGGSECLRSYGVDPDRLKHMPATDALKLVRDVIPSEHVEFFKSFSDTVRFGDYLFVHAGVRPGVGLDKQRQADLRWIREPFLSDDSDHGFTVVHGHTIRPAVDERVNRIGIDTGAYSSGILTAIGIEGRERWYVDTRVSASPAVSAAH